MLRRLRTWLPLPFRGGQSRPCLLCSCVDSWILCCLHGVVSQLLRSVPSGVKQPKQPTFLLLLRIRSPGLLSSVLHPPPPPPPHPSFFPPPLPPTPSLNPASMLGIEARALHTLAKWSVYSAFSKAIRRPVSACPPLRPWFRADCFDYTGVTSAVSVASSLFLSLTQPIRLQAGEKGPLRRSLLLGLTLQYQGKPSKSCVFQPVHPVS